MSIETAGLIPKILYAFGKETDPIRQEKLSRYLQGYDLYSNLGENFNKLHPSQQELVAGLLKSQYGFDVPRTGPGGVMAVPDISRSPAPASEPSTQGIIEQDIDPRNIVAMDMDTIHGGLPAQRETPGVFGLAAPSGAIQPFPSTPPDVQMALGKSTLAEAPEKLRMSQIERIQAQQRLGIEQEKADIEKANKERLARIQEEKDAKDAQTKSFKEDIFKKHLDRKGKITQEDWAQSVSENDPDIEEAVRYGKTMGIVKDPKAAARDLAIKQVQKWGRTKDPTYGTMADNPMKWLELMSIEDLDPAVVKEMWSLKKPKDATEKISTIDAGILEKYLKDPSSLSPQEQFVLQNKIVPDHMGDAIGMVISTYIMSAPEDPMERKKYLNSIAPKVQDLMDYVQKLKESKMKGGPPAKFELPPSAEKPKVEVDKPIKGGVREKSKVGPTHRYNPSTGQIEEIKP